MKRKNGFTLIELLAVIVILAIIALIATPIVLNMINSARKSAAKSSSLGFIDSIEYYAGFAGSNGNGIDLGDYNSELLPTTNIVCTKTNGTWTTCAQLMAKVEAKSKGKAPTDAQISLDTSGKVRNTSWLKYNDYYCVYNGSDIAEDCTKTTPANAQVATDSSSNTPSVPTINTCPGCKFMHTTSKLTIGESEATGAVNNYTELNENNFLGVITDGNNVIQRAFACGIENGTPFCFEGKDTTKFASNIETVNRVFPNCNASSSVSYVNCNGSPLTVDVSDNGTVYVTGDGYCYVNYEGKACCYRH